MNNRTKGAVAGVAGVALLAGGTTFALWLDSDTVDAGTITAGNLEVAALDPSALWQDVTDEADVQAIADLSVFRIVPGDTIRRTFDIDVALEGTNMLGTLELTLNGTTVDGFEDLLPGLDLSYTVNAGAELIPAGNGEGLGTLADVALRSTDSTAPAAEDAITVPTTLDEVADFTVVVTATFLESTDDRDYTQAKTKLQQLGVTLEQVRSHDR